MARWSLEFADGRTVVYLLDPFGAVVPLPSDPWRADELLSKGCSPFDPGDTAHEAEKSRRILQATEGGQN